MTPTGQGLPSYEQLRKSSAKAWNEVNKRDVCVEELEVEAAELREENDWMRRWMGEFGYTEAFEGWRKFKTPASDDEEKP